MATKATEKVTAEGEKIEIGKSQLDSILAQQEEMKATIALLTKQTQRDAEKLEADDREKTEEKKTFRSCEKGKRRGRGAC